ncbi:MAG: hypothetical protein PUC68_08115 [Firmicutes bacterium]|nr:hypothetical protein [Bacillota bacterium]
MKTYRVREIVNKNLILEFECYAFEDILEGNEPSIEIMVDNPDYYFENDWVYVLLDGKIGHIDESRFSEIAKRMSDARAKAITDPSYYDELKVAEAEWIYALGHPVLVEDEEAYYKSRI